MTDRPTVWHLDEQQLSFLAMFDLKVHEPITITLADIDEPTSQSIGQNRTEMGIDDEAVEILAMYMADGVSMPMPLVWKPTERNKRVAKLDGNHRIRAALVNRGEPSCPALLVTGDTQVARQLAIVVNTQHGRSTRNPDYVALVMRNLRDAEVPVPVIARMFGVSDSKVRTLTSRDRQAERVRKLLPERHARVPFHTLDLIGQIEDAHVRILGELFLDAPKALQAEAIERLKLAASANRDDVAHEIVGELREVERQKHKVRAGMSRPSSQLQDAIQRLVKITDPTRAYFASADNHKAIMRANLAVVMPRLQQLWSALTQAAEVA